MSTEQTAVGIDQLRNVTLVVSDQEAAAEWYTETLGFEVRDDEPYTTPDGAEGRWLTIAPPGNEEVDIALVEPDPELSGAETAEALEATIGTDPMWTFHTDDIEATVERLAAAGVEIAEEPRDLPWGTMGMIADPDGNLLNLRQPPA